MTATEELRAGLDELGVEYLAHENGEQLREPSETGAYPATSWRMGDANVLAMPDGQGTFDLWIDHYTPAQAIAATAPGEDVSALQAMVKAQSDYIVKLRGEYKALDEQMERTCSDYRYRIRRLKAELDAARMVSES